MRIELQLTADTADAVRTARGGRGHSGAARLEAVLRAHGSALQPVHPGAVHPVLAPFFFADVADEAAATEVVEQLRGMEGVEAAYLRPDNQMP